MRFLIFVLMASLAIAPTDALAGKKAGITMPDTVSVGNKTLVLNGMGLREATWLKVDVYVAALYVETASSDPARLINSDQTKRLVLRFVRDVGRDDILKAWNDGFKNNATVPLGRIQSNIDRLNTWTPAFKDGDTLVFTYVPGAGVAVDINGARKGVIKDDDFARSLFAIWLGPKPPTSALKKGILGSHGAKG